MPCDTSAFLSAWNNFKQGIHTGLESRCKRSKFTNGLYSVSLPTCESGTGRGFMLASFPGAEVEEDMGGGRERAPGTSQYHRKAQVDTCA